MNVIGRVFRHQSEKSTRAPEALDGFGAGGDASGVERQRHQVKTETPSKDRDTK